jgi:hypothetical protein
MMQKMLPRWTFLDYVDNRGNNRISEWLRSIPVKARVEFESLLDTLRGTRLLDRPQTGKLHGNCEGLWDFVFKADNVQYRPLFCYGPDAKAREITILVGAIEKGSKLRPPGVCKIGLARKDEIMANRKRVVRHVRI